VETARRILAALAVSALALLLTGCTPVDRVAARLNANGTVDLGICQGGDLERFETYWLADEKSGSAVTTAVDDKVRPGDVIRLDVAPRDAEVEYLWVRGLQGDRTVFDGQFAVDDLESGEWVWAQSGVFVGTVDVEHCELSTSPPRID
jgi:hypothetical protein